MALLLAWPAGAQMVGVCTHFMQNKGVPDLNIPLMRQAGVAAVRDDFSWNAVERERGVLSIPPEWRRTVTALARAGIEPLLILDYGNRFYDGGDKPRTPEAIAAFARYAEFVAREFRGTVRRYEVWNEWDIGIGRTTPGDAEGYVRLLKAVYPRVKAVDHNITVSGGAMTSGGIRKGWLEDMLRAGALDSLDAVSIHSYNHSGKGRARTPEAWREFVEAAWQTVRKYSGGRDVPLYVTEMGWPTPAGERATTPIEQAAFLARTYLLGRTLPYLKGIWWYDFQDDGWSAEEREHNFGVVRPDLTPKPAYYALGGAAELAQRGFIGRVEAGDPDLWALRFEGALAVWYAGEGERRVLLNAGGPRAAVRMGEIGRRPVERPWGHRDWPGNRGAVVVPDEIGLVAGANPIVLWGDFSGVGVRVQAR